MTESTFLIKNNMMKQPTNHDELEELYYERIENKIPKRELVNLRNKYDQGWNGVVKT